MPKGKFVGNEGTIALRGVVRGGKLAGIIDHDGVERGIALVDKNEQTGMNGFSISSGKAIRLRKQLSNLMTKSWCGRYVNIASGANTTTHGSTALSGHFDAVRLLIPNGVAVPITGVRASIAMSNIAGADNSSDTINPPGAWKDLLVSGASSFTLAAGTDADAVSWTTTDWFAVNSLGRVDSGTFPVMHWRVEIPAANANITVTNYPVTDWETEGGFNGGFFYRPRTQAVLGCTTKSNFTSTATAGQHIPVVIQYLSRKTGLSIYVCMDSLGEGAAATYRNSSFALFAQIAKASTDFPVEVCNQGMTGKIPSVYLARAKALFAAGVQADVALFSPFSPNGVSGKIDAGEINTFKSQFALGVRQFIDAGTTPIVVDAAPTNYAATSWGDTDSLRTTFNDLIAASGVDVFSLASQFSGTMNNGQIEYSAGGSFDGIHPTLALRQKAGAALADDHLKRIIF